MKPLAIFAGYDKDEIIFKYEIGMSLLFRAHNIELISYCESVKNLCCCPLHKNIFYNI